MPENISAGYVIAGLAVMGVITVLLRLAPFVALSRLQNSRVTQFLGIFMPAGVMVVLVMYTLRDTSTEFRSWVPAVAGMAVVIGLHLWRRSSVLSIFAGTAVYVALASFLS